MPATASTQANGSHPAPIHLQTNDQTAAEPGWRVIRRNGAVAVSRPLSGCQAESSLRTISAPALRALSFPRATGRDKGAMPQFVQG